MWESPKVGSFSIGLHYSRPTLRTCDVTEIAASTYRVSRKFCNIRFPICFVSTANINVPLATFRLSRVDGATAHPTQRRLLPWGTADPSGAAAV